MLFLPLFLFFGLLLLTQGQSLRSLGSLLVLVEFNGFDLRDWHVFALDVVQRVVYQSQVFPVTIFQEGALHGSEGALDLLGLKALDFFVFSQGVAEDSEGPSTAISLQLNLLFSDVQQKLAQHFL